LALVVPHSGLSACAAWHTSSRTERELATAIVLELALTEATAKVRTGGPKDLPEDLALPHWAGTIPVTLTTGVPKPADGPRGAVHLPDYLDEKRLGMALWQAATSHCR
jgi:hypothetical protein